MIVSADWLASHLNDANLVLICVQESPDFCREHIANSRTLDVAAIVITRDNIPNELAPPDKLAKSFSELGITSDSRVILYGERLGILAARAYWTLDYLGLAEHAALLNGGKEEWTRKTRPLTTTPPPQHANASLSPSAHPQVLTTTDQLRISRDAALLDGRPEAEFTGKRNSLDVAEAGHIPGAASLYWQRLLVSPDNPVFRPDEELRQLFAEATHGKHTVITYCRTGMQSSLDYFVAKYLGYDASMYDGSFFEWSLQRLPAEVSRP